MSSTNGTAEARHHRFPLLDPIRGIAALGVLLVHTSIFASAVDDPWYGRLLAHLDIGVAVFFLLSAFVLYRPFVEARVSGADRTPFTDYGVRRFLRIMPAYWAVLVLTAIVPGMAGAFTGNWWVYWGLLQSYPVYEATGQCATDPLRCGVPVAWTLTIEVGFYLVLPLFVLAMGWFAARLRTRWLWFELTVIAAIAAVSILIQSSTPSTDLHTWLFFSPLGRGLWFGLGLALAAVSVHIAHRTREPKFVGWLRRHPGPPVVAAVALYVVMVNTVPSLLAFPLTNNAHYTIAYVLAGIIGVLALLPAVFGADGGGLVRRALANRVLVWLGLVSYGIYLWHFPIMIFLLDRGVRGLLPLTGATLAVTLVCAGVSYYALERPLVRLGQRPRVDSMDAPAYAT